MDEDTCFQRCCRVQIKWHKLESTQDTSARHSQAWVHSSRRTVSCCTVLPCPIIVQATLSESSSEIGVRPRSVITVHTHPAIDSTMLTYFWLPAWFPGLFWMIYKCKNEIQSPLKTRTYHDWRYSGFCCWLWILKGTLQKYLQQRQHHPSPK